MNKALEETNGFLYCLIKMAVNNADNSNIKSDNESGIEAVVVSFYQRL